MKDKDVLKQPEGDEMKNKIHYFAKELAILIHTIDEKKKEDLDT